MGKLQSTYLSLINSVSSLKGLSLIKKSVNLQEKQFQKLKNDIDKGKYAMTPEEIAQAESNVTDMDKVLAEGNLAWRENENRELANEANKQKTSEPGISTDEAYRRAKVAIGKKQEEYRLSKEPEKAEYNPEEFKWGF